MSFWIPFLLGCYVTPIPILYNLLANDPSITVKLSMTERDKCLIVCLAWPFILGYCVVKEWRT